MVFEVYIVQCSDGTYYTGYTTDTNRRVLEHNSGNKGAAYTRSRRPVKLVYRETFATKSEAMKAEYRLKQLSRLEKEALINLWISDEA